VGESQDWFPGRDFPDREVWLKIRATPKGGVSKARRLIHDSASGPMILGINAAKRAAKIYDRMQRLLKGRRDPLQHQCIVKARHDYYRRAVT
jgi:hypothetical protein